MLGSFTTFNNEFIFKDVDNAFKLSLGYLGADLVKGISFSAKFFLGMEFLYNSLCL